MFFVLTTGAVCEDPAQAVSGYTREFAVLHLSEGKQFALGKKKVQPQKRD